MPAAEDQDRTAAIEEAKRVRKSIGKLWQEVHARLAGQVAELAKKKKPLPESLVKNLKVASDQLRLDYRVDPPPRPPAESLPTAPAPPAAEADPLQGLRVVDPDAA